MPVARRPRAVALCQTPGARALPLALGRGRCGTDHASTAWLFAGRDRLVASAAHLAPSCGRVTQAQGGVIHRQVHPQGRRISSPAGMTLSGPALPSDVETLQRLLLAREAELEKARADLVQAKAREVGSEAVIAQLRLAIEKMRRALFGQRSERGSRLLNQMELELEELEASASEDAFIAEPSAASQGAEIAASTRRKASRRPLPEHLPRER